MPTDPVCGMELTPDDATSSIRYEGATYYFCSEECQGRFEDMPTVYVE